MFDFAKAFDVVNHRILLDKLRCTGISGPLLRLLGSFLLSCTIYASGSGVSSSLRDVTSGVPQGSVLGSLLFIMSTTCHQPFKINTSSLPMASALSLAKGTSSCQSDTDNVCAVARSWGLNFSIDKCVALRLDPGSVTW